ncbi:hypothetical protein ACWCPQ_14490 [Nocardia sp. NPDC001965]
MTEVSLLEETTEFIKSRNGTVFGALVQQYSNGVTYISTALKPGFPSAHRDHARGIGLKTKVFGDFKMTNAQGIRVVLSGWSTEAVQ